MNKECKAIQSNLLDAFDDNFIISEEIKVHIQTCSECNAFYQQLISLNEQLFINSEQVEIDNESINQAIDEGVKKRETRENVWNNLGFILVVLTIFSIIGLIIRLGYSQVILIIQIIVFTISPFIIPFVIRKQVKGGA